MAETRVLVVDDQSDKIKAIVTCLMDAGLTRDFIDVEQCGMSARKALSEKTYTLLIVDLMLPMWPDQDPDRMGGLKLLQDMIDRPTFKLPTCVIGLTQHEDLHRELAQEFKALHWSLDQYDAADSGWMDRLKARVSYFIRVGQQTAQPQFETDFAIVTALPSELRAVRSLDWNWSKPDALDETTFVYRGRMISKDRPCSVVGSCAPRMGMVAAALLSMKLIASFRPKLLVMTGICAGVRDECEIGDVLLADPCWDWQSGKHEGKTFLVAPDQIGIETEIRQRFELLSEDKAALQFIHEQFSGTKPKTPPNIFIGPVASGSSVLADSALVTQIRKQQHRKLLGVEMEQYGVFAAAKDASLPRPRVLGIKAVVDFADPSKGDDFQAYGSYVSAHVFRLFAERYGSEIASMP